MENVENNLLASLEAKGFSSERNLYLGPITASAYCCKKVWWYLIFPYYLHCYFFSPEVETPLDLRYVLTINSAARIHTDRFKNKRSRWIRFRVPVTATVIFSRNGFTENSIHDIQEKKQRYQMGDVNAIFLIDTSQNKIYALQKYGVLGCLPLYSINRLIGTLFQTRG
jgi:hypothetical protein